MRHGAHAALCGILLLSAAVVGTSRCPAQSLVPDLGAGGPQLAVLVEEVTRSGAPTGAMMVFPPAPGPAPAGGVLPVAGVVGNYTVDLSVTLTTTPGPGVTISGSPGTITKTGSDPTRLHITIDGGLSSPQAGDTLAHLALVGSTSGASGINLTAAAGYPAGGGDIAWTAFPSGVFVDYYAASEIEEYRLHQPIKQPGAVAVRTFLSADISTAGDVVTLPASATVRMGSPVDLFPKAALDPGSFDILAVPGVAIASSGSAAEISTAKIRINTSEAGSFDTITGIVDLLDPSKSHAVRVSGTDLIYQMEAGGLCGYNWRGAELDTVVRDPVTTAYRGGMTCNFDQTFVNDSTGDIVGVCQLDGGSSVGVCTYGKDGTQKYGWELAPTGSATLTGDVGIGWDRGSQFLTVTLRLADGTVLRGRLGPGPGSAPFSSSRWRRYVLNAAWFSANPTASIDVYRRLFANPSSVPTSSAVGEPATLVAVTDPRTGWVQKVWKVAGINTFWAFRADGGGIALGGTRNGNFGEPEITARLDRLGILKHILNSRFTGDPGTRFGLRDLRAKRYGYFDFTPGRVASVGITFSEDTAECDVVVTGEGRHNFSAGPSHFLTSRAGEDGIRFTNDLPNSSLAVPLGTTTHPVEVDIAEDVTGSFTFSDASIAITPWTPDASKASKRTEAVDPEFAGAQVGIDVHDASPDPEPAPELAIDITGTSAGTLSITWDSSPGKRYTIRRTTDSTSGPTTTWPAVPGGTDILSTGTSTSFTLDSLDVAENPAGILRVQERDSR